MDKIWICGNLSTVFERDAMFALAQKTACVMKGKELEMEMVCTSRHLVEDDIWDQLRRQGIRKVYWCRNEAFCEFNYDVYVTSLIKLIREHIPRIVLFHASRLNKIIAAQIQTELEIGLTADCSDFSINDRKQLIQIRPTYQGKKYAKIMTDSRIQMASILPQDMPVMKTGDICEKSAMEFVYLLPEFLFNRTFCKYQQREKIPPAFQPKVVLSGGVGLQRRENFERLRCLASCLEAGIGATRPIVEMGWAHKSDLIGISGKNISPDLLITFGVSGSFQHMAGIYNTKIISVNTDVNAPIHRQCTYFILDDAQVILDKLLTIYQAPNDTLSRHSSEILEELKW